MSAVDFHVWGCRGGRNTHGSRIGDLTSCYGLRAGADLYVFDAGRGLGALADAVIRGGRMVGLAQVHVLVTHAHVDHWEGLKDAAWMWAPGNGIALTVYGPREALTAIQRGYAQPAFVPLEVLAQGTLASFSYVEVAAGATLALPGASLAAVALHHYSGMSPDRRYLDTLGYDLAIANGPRVAYLCDHEPTAATRAVEDQLCTTADLALVDANYGELHEHAFGHGSLAYAGLVAARHPKTWVMATHHGPARTDEAIEEGQRRHGAGRPNLAVAREGFQARWDIAARRFDR
ncbi:MAG: hypothetical protein K8W52_23020 [Deltaproteobacteria bacterium]|nr:hypothetical protein [Deltaproteobacteria bacterium]